MILVTDDILLDIFGITFTNEYFVIDLWDVWMSPFQSWFQVKFNDLDLLENVFDSIKKRCLLKLNVSFFNNLNQNSIEHNNY